MGLPRPIVFVGTVRLDVFEPIDPDRAPRPRRARSDAPYLRAAPAAFTLIELVVSAGLMSIILVSGYLCLHSGLATQQLIEARGELFQSARVALNQMAADLRAACPLSKDVQFAGLDRTIEGMEADNVDFGTHHYRPQKPGEGDFCQMSYFIARVPDSGLYALWRRRNPRFGLNPLAGGQRDEILRGVHGLKLEYYDGIDWHDEWGDPDGRSKAQFSNREKRKRTLTGLPDAVRITLWVGSASSKPPRPGEDEEPPMVFQTIARLQLAGRASGGSDASGGESKGNEKQGSGSQAETAESGGNR